MHDGTLFFFFFQAEDGIRDVAVTGVQTCALPISHGETTYVVVGQLDPRVAEVWELPAETFIAEIDLATWQESSRPPRVAAPPRFPAALRDLAVVVDEATPYGDVEREIR